MVAMIRLIVNADDLGCGSKRDQGIFRAVTAGIVSSASLLANGDDFAVAAREARASGLPVGVHLNLSEGRSLSGVIPGLTGAGGTFPGKAGLRRRLLAGWQAEGAVLREFAAQIARVRETGLEPDHLDSHQHCLLFPALTELTVAAARAAGIRAIRLPSPAEPAAADPPGALGRDLALYRRLALPAARTLRAARLFTPDGLWGMPALGRLDEPRLADLLRQLPPGTWELMVHPGFADPARPFSGPAREIELAALTAPSIARLVAAREIHLSSFGACACAC